MDENNKTKMVDCLHNKHSCFHVGRFAYVSKFAYMQILHTCVKVYSTMRSHGF